MQDRRFIGELGRFNHIHRQPLDAFQPLAYDIQPAQPAFPFGGMVPGRPGFHGGQHAHHLLASDLIVAARSVVRRRGLPGGRKDGFVSQDQTGALRAADGLATAVGDDRCTALQMHIGNGEYFGGGIYQHGYAARFGEGDDGLQGERIIRLSRSIGQHIDHGCPRAEGGLQFFAGGHINDTDADVTDGVIIYIA